MRSALLVAAALLLAGCTSSEPLDAPADLRSEIEALLGPGVEITGETCASLPVDAPSEGSHRFRAEKSMTGGADALLADLRAAAVAEGWQEHQSTEYPLALAGPRPGTQLVADRTADGLDVRVQVEYRCSSPSPLFQGRGPVLTDAQADRLDRLHAAASEMVGAIYAEFGEVPADWPGPALPDDPATCQEDGRAGVLWLVPTTPELPVPDPDAARGAITAAVPPPWQVRFAEPEDRGGTTVLEFNVSADIGGTEVAAPFELVTFTGGAAKLFSRGGRVCVPAG